MRACEKSHFLGLIRKMSKILMPCAGFVINVVFIASASAATYRITNLSATLPQSSIGKYFLNNAGHIMGGAIDSQSPPPNRYTYIYKDGVVTRLPSPPSSYVAGVSFNDQDDVIGNLYQYAQDGTTLTAQRVFLYKGGQLTDITNSL